MKRLKMSALFTLAGLAISPFTANASQQKELIPVDELPLETRAHVFEKVIEAAKADPSVFEVPNAVIVLDHKGTVYVVDKKAILVEADHEPSCVSGSGNM